MNVRKIAEAISDYVDDGWACAQVYRVLVAEVAEPGALEQLWGIGVSLDREIVRWSRKHIPDPLAPPSSPSVVADPPETDRSCAAPMEAAR